ncbi:hypothetical protein N0V90_009024 [Kalmusia sp. IMI 367209]|nr:hypothetical protein N0V90_009024 [Kalmusia sp. IMI 367209]
MKTTALFFSGLLGRCLAGYAEHLEIIQTSSGPVRGHEAPLASNVTAYLGIPYAKPPVGDLRFAPPQQYRHNGSQIFGEKLVDEEFSEDCLVLNIWSGGYVAGSSNAKTYDGARFVEQEDIVLVTINYRLNILGFPGAPGAQNFGLLDQRLAAEWVRDNIAKFGGDPSRITLAGESAGAGSVDYYSYAWTADPIVAGFIAQSGTIQIVQTITKETAAELWYNATLLLGCGDSSNEPEVVLQCVRSKNVTEVMQAMSQIPTVFTPFVDDIIVFEDYAARSAAGNFAKKPLLIGHNDFEAGLFDLIQRLKGVVLPPEALEALDNRLFFCPVPARAAVNVQHDIPVWRYRYFGEWPDMRLSKTIYTGAYHGGEVNVLFDTVPHRHGIPASTWEEVEFGRYMRGAWVAFATNPEKGLEEYGWPMYDSDTESLVRLAYGNTTGLNVASPTAYDSVCGSTMS